LSLEYESIISVENLLDAWREFVKGKRKRIDVQEFGRHLMKNVLGLHRELSSCTYLHGGYHHFKINDPKPRDIHKASVRDRLVHHALYRQLYPFFDTTFIFDSYSCRDEKGTHKSLKQFRIYASRASSDHANTVWILKCDVRKFFASIDHEVLLKTANGFISDSRIVALITDIVESFDSGQKGKGLPLGNLTSQLLVNIYMNEFDQYVKNELKIRYYIRYADDFAVLSKNKSHLLKMLPYMEAFLRDTLKLQLHPNKVSISTLASGIDFLGWIHFPNHRVLRTATKRRMFRNLAENYESERVQSYLGMLLHGNAHDLQQKVAKLASRR
jgi:RNA-directed DNA polymerase